MIPPTVNVGLHFDLLQLNNNKAVDTYQHEVKLDYLLGCSRIIRQIKCMVCTVLLLLTICTIY